MKKHYSLMAAASLCSIMSLAQPVLTASGMNPVSGDLFTFKRTQGVSPGTGGANQTWNLSAMTSTVTQNYTVGPVSQSPNASSFPNANLQFNDGSVYSFWNVGSSAMVNRGQVANSTVMSYNNGEDFLHYPFSYNNTFTDAWSCIYTVSSITFTRSGNTTVTYDGYGNLTTPGFSQNNVARVHFVQDYKDSSMFNGMHFINNEYFWFVNGYHQPVASVFTLAVVGTSTVSGGHYSDNLSSTVSIDELNGLQTVMLAPNPASDKVLVGLSSGEALTDVRLFNLEGKMVIEMLNVGLNQVELDLRQLSPGIYFAKVLSASGSLETRKVEVYR